MSDSSFLPSATKKASKSPMTGHQQRLTSSTGELDVTALVAASPQEKHQMLGQRLHPQVYLLQPHLACRITGMLLETDISEILCMLDYPQFLQTRVEEAADLVMATSAQEAAVVGIAIAVAAIAIATVAAATNT